VGQDCLCEVHCWQEIILVILVVVAAAADLCTDSGLRCRRPSVGDMPPTTSNLLLQAS
jgi:hypothetical protein